MKRFFKTMAFTLLGLVLSSNLWAEDKTISLNNIGAALGTSANTTAATTEISDDNSTDKYTLNYYQCKKQSSGSSHAIFLTKNVSPYISNKTPIPGSIKSVTIYTASGASKSTNYDCAFGTSEFTTATAGIGAQNIGANNNHKYDCPTATKNAKYFCITLGNSNNGQVLNIDIVYEKAGDDDCTTEVDVNKGTITGAGCDITISDETVCADGEGGSVTVTPAPIAHYHCTGVTATIGSVTGPVAGVYTVSGITAETTISAAFAENDFATISWSVNGNPTTGGSEKVYVGEKVSTLPTDPTSLDCDGSKVFVGWTNAVITNGAKPAVLFTDAADAPEIKSTAAVTYYAVFATKTEAAGASGNTEITTDISEVTGTYGDGTEKGDYKWSYTQLMLNTKCMQGNSSKSSILWNTTAFPNNISKVELNIGKAAGTTATAKVCFGSSAKPEGNEISLGQNTAYDLATTGTITLDEIPANSTYISLVWTNGASYYASVKVYYGSGTTYSDYVTTCSEVTKYTITAAVNDVAMGSATVQGQASFEAVEEAILNLVAAPKNNNYKFVEWTVSDDDCILDDKNAASTTLKVGTTALTVTANFAAKETYTITWLVNGNAAQGSPTTSVLEGEAITALPTTPTSEDCFSLKDFVGWTAQENYSGATAPSDLFTTADKAPAITANTTFYAVFAAATGAPTFNLTAASDMVAGVYAIGALRSDKASNDYYFADGTATTGSNGDANVTESYVTAEDGLIASLPDGAVEFTFTGDNVNGFTISFVDGNTTKYLGYTAASNRKLAYGDYSTTKWIVDAKDNPLNEGGVTLYSPYGTDQKYRISENSTGTSAIRGYSDGTAYRAIYLFKKDKGSYGDYAVTCVAPSVENPVFETDATNPYVTSVKVELSCETEGATIYYNIDSESDPTSESAAYNTEDGIVLNTNGEHTIKAIAIKGEDESQVVSKTYTVLIPYTTAAALQSVVTTTETTVAVTFNDWIVTGVAGKNAYIVDGNNNGVLVFTDGHGFAVNDHVSGTVITTLVKYNGSCELKGVKASDFTTVEQGAAATPVEFTDFSQLTSAYQSAVVTLKNAKFNSSKLEDANGVKITPFTTFYSGAVTDLEYNASYDYTGVVVMFNIVEVCPRNAGDIDKLAEKTSPTVKWYTDDTKTTELTSATVHTDETFSAFLYTNNEEGTKTYSSSNTDVAEISTDGAITIKGIGQTTIKCVVGESTLYFENDASFTLQVKAAGSDDVTWVAEEQGYDDQKDLTGEAVMTDPVTILFTKVSGSTPVKYYKNATKGNAARFYQNNTLTITAPEGKLISSIIITCVDTKGEMTANAGSITSEDMSFIWTGMTKEVVFTPSSTSWIYSLDITYMTGTEVTLSVEDINMQVTDEPKTIVYNCVGKENPTITYSDYDEDVISIAEGKVTAKKAGSTEVTAKIAQEGQYSSAEAKFTVTVTEKTPVTLSFEQESYTAKLGETFETPTLTKSAEVAVTYSSSNTEVAEVNETTGAINHKKQGTTTITAKFAGNETYEAAEASYELKVVDPDIDILTATLIGKTSYENWSNVTDATGTEYAGNSTTGSQTPNVGSIQIRTTNSNSGIVSTHAIGYLRGVTVDFSSDPASGKSLNVYAKNTAYESAADLYDSKKQGTLIGSFTTSGDIVLAEGISFDDNYKYIGVRSSNGAMYLNSISIKWAPVEFGPDFTLEDKAAGAFATICLPRKIDHVENATLFHILDGDITKVNFESVTDFSEEQAGMPYLVQVTADGDVNFYYAEAGEAVINPVTPEDANGFVGRLAEGEEEITSETALLVSGGKLYQAGTGCYLTQHHAYIEVSAINTVAKAPNMAARRVTLYNAEAQTPTNLNGLNGNMKAQKVMKDGQFYIIREAKMYNAQGIEVQ